MSVAISVVVVMILVGDLAFVGWFLRQHGMFAPVKPIQEKVPPMWFAYAVHHGRYPGIAPVMEQVHAALKDNHGLTPELGLGLYFDNPREVAPENLRSLGGCIISQTDFELLATTSTAFRLGALPETQAVVVTFPYNGKLSIFIGAMRVYRLLNQYLSKNNLPAGPVMEVYDFSNRQIRYIRPFNIPNEGLEQLLGE